MKDNQYIREFPKNAAKKDKSPKKTLLWAGSVIILALAAISFIFVPGVGRALGGGSGSVEPFGYYNKKPIEFAANSFFTQMVRQYEEETREEQARAGRQNAGDDSFAIFNRAFNASVFNEAFSFAVAQSGYIVPEGAIDRAMIPYFYDQNGVYSPRLFNSVSDSRKIEIRREITRQLVYQRYYEDLFGSNSERLEGSQLYGKKTSSKESGFLGRMGEKERSFEIAAFPVSSYPEDEAVAFARENSENFTKYNLSVITVNTEDEAKNVLRQINNNEVLFDDAAKDLSLQFYSDGDGKLSSPYQYALKNIASGDENFNAITSLETGAVSGVIKTSNGYSLFRCDAPPAPPDFTDEAARSAVLNYLRSYERVVIEDYFTNRANDFATLAAQSGFETACEEFGAERVEAQSFPLNYGSSELFPITPSIPQLAGADRNERFLLTAFSLSEGEISSPIVLGDNVIVLRLLSETIKPGDENAAQFIAPYYSMVFDQSAMQNAVFADPRLKNNFVNVYFKYFYTGS